MLIAETCVDELSSFIDNLEDDDYATMSLMETRQGWRIYIPCLKNVNHCCLCGFVRTFRRIRDAPKYILCA